MEAGSSVSGATLRRPVQIVKKRSGPLDEALSELQLSSDVRSDSQATSDITSTNTTCSSSHNTPTTSPSKAIGVVPRSSVVAAGASASALATSTPPASRRRAASGSKDKEKKRERWLLTRKTWKYMTDAGRKLIPDSAQNRKEDIPKIEAHFQQVCAAEPRFVLWRRKSSYPGANRNSKRRLKQLLQHTGRFQQQQLLREQEEAHAADRVIDWLQSYLKLDEAFKTTTLLGSKTVRPDQTASPSAQRPSGTSKLGVAGGMTGCQLPSSTVQQLGDLEQQLERLRTLSRSATLQTLNMPPECITPAILQDKTLLKQIYNTLKKQQLHRILSKHSTAAPCREQLKHASSLSSLLHFGGSGLSARNSIKNQSRQHLQQQQQQQQRKQDAAAAATARPQQRQQLAATTLESGSANINSFSSRCDVASATTPGSAVSRQRKPPTTLQLPGSSADTGATRKVGHKKHIAAVEKQYNSCGTQTNFIQLSEIKRLAEEYKQQKLADEAAASPTAGTDEETEQRGGAAAAVSAAAAAAAGAHHMRRKSSIDNEDVSQSVSDTIKRYLRMARKKSVHDADANRFKRVNYDRNLRNIRAKGEINPPGMDEGNGKAVQTLDAWPLITLAFIRGSADCTHILESAHAEWQRALHERIQKKLDYDSKLAAGGSGTAAYKQFAHGKSPHSSGSSSSAPTSPTSDQYTGVGGGSSSSTQATPLTSPHNYAATAPGSAASCGSSGGSSGGLLHTSSQFFSNLWHGAGGHYPAQEQSNCSNYGPTGGGDGGNSVGDTNSNNSKNASLAVSSMQKSKSSSNVGQFVSRKILKSRSKSQTRPVAQHPPAPPFSKWAPSDKFTWTSETGERLLLSDASLQTLSDIEAKILQRVALQKISELNVGINITVDNEGKAQKRQVLAKKKAMTTSFFDIGKKDDGSNLSIFGNSLECCVTNDRKRSNNLNASSLERGSRNSIASLFRGGSSSSSAGTGAGAAGGNSSTSNSKLHEDVRSCESLPTSDISGINRSHSKGSYFGNLTKSTSMQISRSQSDVRRKSQDLNMHSPVSSSMFDSLHQPVSDFSEGCHNDMPLQVPSFVGSCIRYLEEHGLHQVGLFRVSTSKKRVKQMREDFDKHANTNIDADSCPHDVATLLKEFLRDLPEPLLRNNLYQAFLQTQRIRNRRLQLEAISHLVKLLPAAHRDTLYVLLKFLARVAACSDDTTNADGTVQLVGNKMDSNNLARIFAPNMLRSSLRGSNDTSAGASARIAVEEQQSMNDAINVIRIMIDHYEELFRVPAELVDIVYSNMLDSCPDKLYALCEQRSMLAANREEVGKSSLSLAQDGSGGNVVGTNTSAVAEAALHMATNEVAVQQPKAPKRLYTRESVMHDNDASRAPEVSDVAVAAANKRYIDPHASRGSHAAAKATIAYAEEQRRLSNSAVNDRRQSSPNVLNKSVGIVSASLQIPVPMQAHIKAKIQQQQQQPNWDSDDVFYASTAPKSVSEGREYSDIPYIEEASTAQELEYGTEYFPIAGSLSFSTKIEASQPSQHKGRNTRKDSIGHSSSTFRLRRDSTAAAAAAAAAGGGGAEGSDGRVENNNTNPRTFATASLAAVVKMPNADYKMLKIKSTAANEPKLPASISNIGGAILRSKTADFERMSSAKKQQIPKATATTATTTPTHLYKRQELISSSKRSPK